MWRVSSAMGEWMSSDWISRRRWSRRRGILIRDIEFREGNILALELEDGSLAGIIAFYAIVNIPPQSLPIAFAEMHRVLKPGGLLLLSFHIGEEVIRPEELWGNRVSMEFYKLQPERIQRLLTHAAFVIEDIVERDPYAPDVEFQSRRAYVFARKPAAA